MNEYLQDNEYTQQLLTEGYCVIKNVFNEKEIEEFVDTTWHFLETVSPNVNRCKPETWYPMRHRTYGTLEDPWPSTYRKSFPDMVQSRGIGFVHSHLREQLAGRVYSAYIYNTNELLSSKEGMTILRPQSLACEEGKVYEHPQKDHVFHVCGKQQSYTCGEHFDHSLLNSDYDETNLSGDARNVIPYLQASVSLTPSNKSTGCFVCWPKSHSNVHRSILKGTYRGENSEAWVPLTDEELYRMRDEFNLKRKYVEVNAGDVVVWRSDLCHGASLPVQTESDEHRSTIQYDPTNPLSGFRIVAYCGMMPAISASSVSYERKLEAYLYGRTTDHRPEVEWWHPDWESGYNLLSPYKEHIELAEGEEKKSNNAHSKTKVRCVKTFYQLLGYPPRINTQQAYLYGLIPYGLTEDEVSISKRQLIRIGVQLVDESFNSNTASGTMHHQLTELVHPDGPMLGQDKWLGGVASPCGKFIYGVPGTHSRILRIDVDTGNMDYIGPEFKGQFKWLRGVEVPASVMGEKEFPSGACICLPCNASSILRIDPHTQEAITFGELEGSWMYHGGDLGDDGFIYAIPANATRVLKIDPRSLETWFIGPELEGQQKWYGGLKGSNGAIYGIPQNASGCLKIQPETQEVTIVGEGLIPKGDWKWHGGLTSANHDIIYGFVNNADTVLKLDTRTDEITFLGGSDVLKSGRHRVPYDGKYKYLGGALAPDGKAYLFPCDAERVLCIDTNTDEVYCVGPYLLEGENKYQNGFVGKDGFCYAIPQRARGVLKVGSVKGDDGEEEVRVEQLYCGDNIARYKEKFEGGVLSPRDGALYCIPMRAKTLVKVVPGEVDSLS